jgi:hypothetical protein
MGGGSDLCSLVPSKPLQEAVCYVQPDSVPPVAKLAAGGGYPGGILWQSVCFCGCVYMLSFYYSERVVKSIVAKLSKLKEWQLKSLGALSFVAWVCMGLFYHQNRTFGMTFDGYPPFQRNDEAFQKGYPFYFNTYTFEAVMDLVIQSVEVVLPIMFMSQAPFHLAAFGGSTLGAYVNQMIMIWFVAVWMEGYMMLQYIGKFDTGSGVVAEATVLLVQLGFVFVIMAAYWSLAAAVLFKWTLLPFTAMEMAVRHGKPLVDGLMADPDDIEASEKKPLLPTTA